MNMEKEKTDLKKIIYGYFQKTVSLEDLNAYAWEKIQDYSKCKASLPEYDEKLEGEYWYAIWQIQHLADSEHLDDGLLQQKLLDILAIFDKKKSLPRKFYGKRP
ncbi:MAG: hypothetical protein KR126chlam1_01218 [Chlamydiae bacterium]|nr:hypothetical protein [Chlamydiota bacterium]